MSGCGLPQPCRRSTTQRGRRSPSGPTTNPSLGAAGVGSTTEPSLDESRNLEHAEPKNAIDATTHRDEHGGMWPQPPSFQSRSTVEHGGRHGVALHSRESGGTGRRAGFRTRCPKGLGGSSPPSRTPSDLQTLVLEPYRRDFSETSCSGQFRARALRGRLTTLSRRGRDVLVQPEKVGGIVAGLDLGEPVPGRAGVRLVDPRLTFVASGSRRRRRGPVEGRRSRSETQAWCSLVRAGSRTGRQCSP